MSSMQCGSSCSSYPRKLRNSGCPNHLEMETSQACLEAMRKVTFTFATIEWCHQLSIPEYRKRNTYWGKILPKNPQKKYRSSQHWMDYSLHWVLWFLFSFTEHLGFILYFWKSFLGNSTLSSKFWSGLKAGSPGTLVYCLLKKGTAVLTWIHNILVLFSRECVGLNLPYFSSATLLWWNKRVGFVSLVFVSRLFFSLCF